MLDRLPTELIQLVVDATSHSIWTRKATLDRIGLVSKSYRRASATLRDRIVVVPNADAAAQICSWSVDKRDLVETILLGKDSTDAPDAVLQDAQMSELIGLLPHLKHAFVCCLDGAAMDLTGTESSFRVDDENPCRALVSLSLRHARILFRYTEDPVPFANLQRLRLDLISRNEGWFDKIATEVDDDGLGQFLTARCLPSLRIFRLSCITLPKVKDDFLQRIKLVQVDLTEENLGSNLDVLQTWVKNSPSLLCTFSPSAARLCESVRCAGLRYALFDDWGPYSQLVALRNLGDLIDVSMLRGPRHVPWIELDPLQQVYWRHAEDQIARARIKVFDSNEADEDWINPGYADLVAMTGLEEAA